MGCFVLTENVVGREATHFPTSRTPSICFSRQRTWHLIRQDHVEALDVVLSFLALLTIACLVRYDYRETAKIVLVK
jgi:hypothetical protein